MVSFSLAGLAVPSSFTFFWSEVPSFSASQRSALDGCSFWPVFLAVVLTAPGLVFGFRQRNYQNCLIDHDCKFRVLQLVFKGQTAA